MVTGRQGRSAPTTLRTLVILEEVARAGAPVTPTEINRAIGLPKPTIHRLFAMLEAEGYLTRELDGRTFSPGRRLRRMAGNVMSSPRTRTARLSVLNRLAEEIGETCNIAIPDGEAMTYLDRVETKWPLRIQLPVGTRVPLYCTASGKMYLSHLDDTHLDRFLRSARLESRAPATITDPSRLRDEIAATRRRGFSEDAEEFMEGMIAIAAPVLDAAGRLACTVSFHAPAMRLSLADGRRHATRLRAAADELSALLLQ